MGDHVTLITGADGYVGRHVAARLLDQGDRLVLAVRAADDDELDRKRHRLVALLGDDAEHRVQIQATDVTAPDPFAAIDPVPITRIVHAAAVTRFNVGEELARAVNVEGTARIIEFARRCPGLDRIGMLSTVYSAGLAGGVVAEHVHEGGRGFANYYEWSKHASECVAVAADLPLVILRTATVIADDTTGRVTQHNAVHNTLRLYFYGLLSLMPGDVDTPMYFVTGDFVADGVVRLMDPALPEGVYHVCHDRTESLTLGAFVGLAFDEYERHPHFQRRRVLRPLYCDLGAFDDLVAAARAFGGSPISQALESVSPFARQLYVANDVRNDRFREVWNGSAAPDPRELVTRTCAHLVATRWGRQVEQVAQTMGMERTP